MPDSPARAAALAALLVAAPLAGAGLAGAPLAAQAPAPARTTVSQGVAWLQLFEEHRLDGRWALHLEAQLRRADPLGRTTQQLLLRPGVLFNVGGGAQLGAGYAWVETAVYGEAPAAAPFGEHRAWQQLVVPATTGPVRWSTRFRTEQRWIAQVPRPGAEPTAWRYRDRVRVMTRASVDAPRLGLPLRRAYLTSYGELFLHAGESWEGQIFDQSRLAAQVGWRVTPRLRVEGGYMQQFIQRGGSRLGENNHTLVVTMFATTGR